MLSILKRSPKLCFIADVGMKIVFFSVLLLFCTRGSSSAKLSVLVLNVPSLHFLSVKY